MKLKLPAMALVAGILLGAEGTALAAGYEPTKVTLPKPQREFRGAWVATVGNIDWPSRKTLSTAEQKAELVAILDSATRLKMNAIIFQVRPACDAMYASQIEPWSEFLTGEQGKAPQPAYDPLAFAITEAHRRGLELHAWFNPYRALHGSAKSPVAANHISKTKPQLVRRYGEYLWLDPGEKEVQDYSLRVVMDVVKRYDVDGVHFDDYFYPYAIQGRDGQDVDFPDEPSWKKFSASGRLTRDDWRRENVNSFIRRVYESTKAMKPWVKFGVSPFGIWRPGHPAQIKGFDAYAQLYADSRKWLVNGWVDYLVPQLYWSIEGKEQSFPVLLNWWDDQNAHNRHIWPGLNTTRTRERTPDESATRTRSGSRPRENWRPEEITSQIRLAAKQPVSAGHVHWNMKSLMRSPGLQAALSKSAYAEPALIPACKWLGATAMRKPELKVAAAGSSSVKLTWESGRTPAATLWVLQCKRASKWTTQILPAAQRIQFIDGEPPEVVALSAVDRTGNLGEATTFKRSK